MSQDPGPQPQFNPYASPFGSAPPPPQPARVQVAGPAIGLMVVAALDLVSGLISLLEAGLLVFISVANPNVGGPDQQRWAIGGIGLAVYGTWGVVLLCVAATILVGAIRMKKLESRGLAMTASILAMVPCISCCLVGLPIGIWSLVVLSKPEVRSEFR
jgi:hypothetical protein